MYDIVTKFIFVETIKDVVIMYADCVLVILGASKFWQVKQNKLIFRVTHKCLKGLATVYTRQENPLIFSKAGKDTNKSKQAAKSQYNCCYYE